MNNIQTPEERLSGVIGQIIVENAKLGYEVQLLRLRFEELSAEKNQLAEKLKHAEQRAEAADARMSESTRQFEHEIHHQVRAAE